MFDELIAMAHARPRFIWILVIGVTAALGLLAFGAYQVDQLHLKSVSEAAQEQIRARLFRRYELGALSIAGAAVIASVRTYRRDRRAFF